MTIYLIREDKTYETFDNVIEWNINYVIYQAGRGRCKIYAVGNEYFTDVLPEIEEDNE